MIKSKYESIRTITATYREKLGDFCVYGDGYTFIPFPNTRSLDDTMCFIEQSTDNNIWYTVDRAISDVRCTRSSLANPKPGVSKLFLTSDTKLSRDLVRRDYKIVRDPSVADFIVAPKIEWFTMRYPLMIEGELGGKKDLYLCSVNFDSHGDVEMEHKLWEKGKDSLISYLNKYTDVRVISEKDPLKDKPRIVFMKASKPVTDAVMRSINGFARKIVVEDVNLPLNHTLTVSVDQLMMWGAGVKSTEEIVLREIADSDWKKYPLTISAFLNLNLPRRSPSNFPSCCIPMVRYIRYSEIYTYGDVPEDYDISEEDWSMLQDYQMRLMNIEGDSGHVREYSFKNKLPFNGNMIRKCYTVAKYKMKTDMSTWKNINNVINPDNRK